MEITIKNKKYELKFGFQAIHYLDKLHFVQLNGMEFGQGIRSSVIALMDENPVAIFETIKAGLITEKQKPSDEDLESYVADLAEKGQMDQLFQDLLRLYESQPLTKSLAKKVRVSVKKAGKDAE